MGFSNCLENVQGKFYESALCICFAFSVHELLSDVCDSIFLTCGVEILCKSRGPHILNVQNTLNNNNISNNITVNTKHYDHGRRITQIYNMVFGDLRLCF